MRIANVCISIAAWLFLTALAGISRGADSTLDAFQRLADQFKFFGDHELLYGRSEIYLADPAAMPAYLSTLAEFTSRNDKVEDLIPLLHQSNPRLRVLAIIALYLKGADHALPEINRMVDDPQAAFPNPPYDRRALRFSGIGPPRESQTVGEVANGVLRVYYDAAGFNYHMHADPFADYWESRKGRTNCAGWFLVRLCRANQHTSPMPDGSLPRIERLRGEIDQIPIEQRRWILLRLAEYECNAYDRPYIVSDGELSRLCHDIGSETMRSMLYLGRGDPPRANVPDDPDLDLNSLRWFVYDHAKDLLGEKDADGVLAAGNAIAAAELRPAMASQWLREELERQSGEFNGWERAKVLAALWRITGIADADFIIDHYFGDAPDPGSFPCERRAFLEACAGHPRPEFSALVDRIIRDPRLDKTGPDSAYALIEIMSKSLGKPLVSDDELNDCRGHDELDQHGLEPFKKLAEWHDKLQASVSQRRGNGLVGLVKVLALAASVLSMLVFRRTLRG
jgi:hypothetical protein